MNTLPTHAEVMAAYDAAETLHTALLSAQNIRDGRACHIADLLSAGHAVEDHWILAYDEARKVAQDAMHAWVTASNDALALADVAVSAA